MNKTVAVRNKRLVVKRGEKTYTILSGCIRNVIDEQISNVEQRIENIVTNKVNDSKQDDARTEMTTEDSYPKNALNMKANEQRFRTEYSPKLTTTKNYLLTHN